MLPERIAPTASIPSEYVDSLDVRKQLSQTLDISLVERERLPISPVVCHTYALDKSQRRLGAVVIRSVMILGSYDNTVFCRPFSNFLYISNVLEKTLFRRIF